ncbi:MAG TPA: ferrous iron transport protein A [Erysipelothrix sp.]|jgi:ferrous iron transport protein A|nr:ferrous iron transport protein A [Erysipelothrix sp.]
MNLSQAEIGQPVFILKINGEKHIRRRLMDMGLTKKQIIVIKKVAPLGDPIEIRVRGYELSLRKEDAKNIDVEVVEL